MATHILVGRKEPTKPSIHTFGITSKDQLEEGQILVHVVKIVLTANTMTYALAGDHPALKYFGHYEVPEGGPDPAEFARTPAWGTGVVVGSKCAAVPEGMRIHGFFTLSSMVVLTPEDITDAGFADAAPNRKDMFGAYKYYTNHEKPYFKDATPDEEDWKMSDGLLFSTGWSMSREAEVVEGEPKALLLSSASSRTAYGAAFSSKFHDSKLKIIGVTSAGNLEYTKGLGVYDVVITNEDVNTLENEPVAIYDVSGKAALVEALYKHYGKNVLRCALVGMTDPNGASMAGINFDLAGGAAPEQYLMFTAIAGLHKTMGKEEVDKQLAAASAAYEKKMMPTARVERRFGCEAVVQTWLELAEGRAPKGVLVGSLWPEEESEPKPPSS